MCFQIFVGSVLSCPFHVEGLVNTGLSGLFLHIYSWYSQLAIEVLLRGNIVSSFFVKFEINPIEATHWIKLLTENLGNCHIGCTEFYTSKLLKKKIYFLHTNINIKFFKLLLKNSFHPLLTLIYYTKTKMIH